MTVPKAIKPLGAVGKFIHMLLVAPSGFGKTVFMGTAPNALFITTDPEGTVSAWRQGSTAKEWECFSWTEVNDAYRYLRDGGIKEMGLDYVVIDNVSAAQTLAMRETMRLARSRNKNLDEFVPSQADYQRSQMMVMDMIYKWNELSVNVLWTSWQTETEDSEGEVMFAPAVHGQKGAIAQQVAGLMNIVGYGQVVEVKGKPVRRIWFTHHGPFRGKDRYDALGAKQDGLTVPKMRAMINKTVAEHTAASKSAPAARRSTPTTKTTSAAPRRTVRRRATS